MAQTFLDFGYDVEVINWNNMTFIPKKQYDFFIDIHCNMERLAPILNKDCYKILHITGAHWLFQNHAEYERLLSLQKRRGISLYPRRLALPSLAVEHADCATILGKNFTIDTFKYSQKHIYQIPISTTILFSWLKDKDYQKIKNNFLWFGGRGMVHKGLDLVLEVFSQMPDYRLIVCGPVQKEKDFEQAFYNELYKTENISTIGFIDVSSNKFLEIVKNCIGVVNPSCSEGGGGAIITCMHAGLIPIISYETGIDVFDFGICLKDCSIEEIKNAVTQVSAFSEDKLKTMSKKAWEYARTNHTREKFADAYRKIIASVIAKKNENSNTST